jgi:hypothetical protein
MLHQSLAAIQDGQLEAVDSWKDVQNMNETHRSHQGGHGQDLDLVARLQSRIRDAQESCSMVDTQITQCDEDVIRLKDLLRQTIIDFDFSERDL